MLLADKLSVIVLSCILFSQHLKERKRNKKKRQVHKGKSRTIKKKERKKIRSAWILFVLTTLVYVLLAWTSSRNTFRSATLTHTLNIYSTLLSDFSCVIPCYYIFPSQALHIHFWSVQVRTCNHLINHRWLYNLLFW